MSPKYGISGHDERRVCVSGRVDPRTLRRYLLGEQVRPMVRERIEEALRKVGLEDLIRHPVANEGRAAS